MVGVALLVGGSGGSGAETAILGGEPFKYGELRLGVRTRCLAEEEGWTEGEGALVR